MPIIARLTVFTCVFCHMSVENLLKGVVEVMPGVLLKDTLALYFFTIVLDHVLRQTYKERIGAGISIGKAEKFQKTTH